MMTHIFDDITLTDGGKSLAYRNHQLETNEAIHNGFATAALVAVYIMGTEEGDRRGIGMLETPEERAELMRCYEQETLREDGGLMLKEVEAVYWWLWRFHDDNDNENDNDNDDENDNENRNEELIQLSIRQEALWEKLIQEYMCRKIEQWAADVLQSEDHVKDSDTYAEWLLHQLGAYTRIRHMRKTDWLDYYQMTELWALTECKTSWLNGDLDLKDVITHLPADVNPETLMAHYFELREKEHAERKTKPTAAAWYTQEKQALSQEDVLDYLSIEQQQELEDYRKQWLRYLSKRLKLVSGSTTPTIWTERVDDKLEEKLIQYLKIQEGTHAWARNMAASIYAMQQKGWVQTDLRQADFRRWATRHLRKNYLSESMRLTLLPWWGVWDKQDKRIAPHLQRLSEYEK